MTLTLVSFFEKLLIIFTFFTFSMSENGGGRVLIGNPPILGIAFKILKLKD